MDLTELLFGIIAAFIIVALADSQGPYTGYQFGDMPRAFSNI